MGVNDSKPLLFKFTYLITIVFLQFLPLSDYEQLLLSALVSLSVKQR